MRCFDRNRYDLTGHYYIRGTEKSVSGTSSVLIEDSAGIPIKSLEIVGKTVQNGTPTPEAPIPIENANDNGMSVTLHGKNLATAEQFCKNFARFSMVEFDGKECVNFRQDNNGKFVLDGGFKPNTQYTISFDGFRKIATGTVAGNGNAFFITYEDGTESSLAMTLDVWKHYKITTLEGKTVINIGQKNVDYRSGFFIDINTFMLQEGAVADPIYVPYFEPTIIEIPTSIDVNGKSVPLTFSEHDKLTVDGLNGKVTYTQGSAMYSYTGEETGTSKLSVVSGNGNNYRSYYSSLFGEEGLRCRYNKSHTSHFEKGDWNPLSLPGTYVARYTDIIFRTDGAQTLDEFKAFLAEQYANGTPVTFMSPRETPIEHDITDTSLGKELLSLLVPKGEDGTFEVKCDIGVSSINVIYYSETKEDKVALTVRYLNLSGEEIREPRTYYVRRGSEFEIIPPHIDGYTIGTIIKGVANSESIIRLFYKEV